MDTASGIPNKEHAIGISNKEPPATPDAPQADNAAKRLNTTAVGISTPIPRVCTVAMVMTVIVIAAPSILMVAPNGIVTEYVSLSKPISSQIFIFTGILAAELLVKKAVIEIGRASCRERVS